MASLCGNTNSNATLFYNIVLVVQSLRIFFLLTFFGFPYTHRNCNTEIAKKKQKNEEHSCCLPSFLNNSNKNDRKIVTFKPYFASNEFKQITFVFLSIQEQQQKLNKVSVRMYSVLFFPLIRYSCVFSIFFLIFRQCRKPL